MGLVPAESSDRLTGMGCPTLAKAGGAFTGWRLAVLEPDNRALMLRWWEEPCLQRLSTLKPVLHFALSCESSLGCFEELWTGIGRCLRAAYPSSRTVCLVLFGGGTQPQTSSSSWLNVATANMALVRGLAGTCTSLCPGMCARVTGSSFSSQRS